MWNVIGELLYSNNTTYSSNANLESYLASVTFHAALTAMVLSLSISKEEGSSSSIASNKETVEIEFIQNNSSDSFAVSGSSTEVSSAENLGELSAETAASSNSLADYFAKDPASVAAAKIVNLRQFKEALQKTAEQQQQNKLAREKAIEEIRQHQQKTQNEVNHTQRIHVRTIEHEKQRLAQDNEREAAYNASVAANQAAYQEYLNNNRMNYYRPNSMSSASQTQQVAYPTRRPEPGSVTQGYDHAKAQADAKNQAALAAASAGAGGGSGGGGGTVYNGPVYNYNYTVNRNISNHTTNVRSTSYSTNNGLIVNAPFSNIGSNVTRP